MTLRDNPREHLFHVITEDLVEGDADTYWCGVDRATSVPEAPVAITIFPGNLFPHLLPARAEVMGAQSPLLSEGRLQPRPMTGCSGRRGMHLCVGTCVCKSIHPSLHVSVTGDIGHVAA